MASLGLAFASGVHAQEVFPPTPYLSVEDRPADFCEECQVEDFEDNVIDAFLSLDCGSILGPHIADPRIPGVEITDSVDGDDGEIDGSGNGGHSYFCVDPERSVEITFASPVAAAGAVWTDGDRGVSIQIEAFDALGALIATSEPTQVADASYFGETDEDRFLGVKHAAGIGSIRVSTLGQGAGIEIDHVTWDAKELTSELDPPTLDETCAAVAGMSEQLRFDANADGAITSDDVLFMLDAIGSLPGDLNQDATVGFDDFLTLSGNFGATEAMYSQGDIDCNAEVTFGDFLIFSGNFGASGPTTAGVSNVPEPTGSYPLFLLAVLPVLVRRKRIS